MAQDIASMLNNYVRGYKIYIHSDIDNYDTYFTCSKCFKSMAQLRIERWAFGVAYSVDTPFTIRYNPFSGGDNHSPLADNSSIIEFDNLAGWIGGHSVEEFLQYLEGSKQKVKTSEHFLIFNLERSNDKRLILRYTGSQITLSTKNTMDKYILSNEEFDLFIDALYRCISEFYDRIKSDAHGMINDKIRNIISIC